MPEACLITEKLTKQFGDRKAVDNVSIELPTGAFLGIFGPNGAGKTTLLRMLSTVSRPSSGAARLCGLDLKENPDEARALIGLISHEPMLYPDLTALQNLELYANLYNVPNPDKRAMEMLEAVELKHRRFDAVKTFSRGMTQRLAIARALINDPAVVFLDEPYSGLDPHAVDVFDRIIEATRADRTFIMVSHDLAKGYDMSTHLLLLAKGRVVMFAPKEEVPFEEFRTIYLDTVGMGVA